MALHLHHPPLRQVQLMGDERAYQRANEADGDRHETTAVRSSDDRATDAAANAGNDEQDEQSCQREAHGGTIARALARVKLT